MPPTILNPCELEIDLFCKGIRIDSSCSLDRDARLFSRTRAGLGSGLELVIPGSKKPIWINIPVEEDFVQVSPYLLVKRGEQYLVRNETNHLDYPVEIPSEPKWYSQHTTKGTEMCRVGVLQGTYLGIYLDNSCGFWYLPQPLNCRFCTSGLNVGTNEIARKDVDEVVEVCRATKSECGTTFVHFNSGFQQGKDLDHFVPYVKPVKERVGMLVGIQAIPCPKKDYWKYDRLIDLGADHFSFCYEFHNPEWFRRLCPGKEKLVGQETFFRAMEYTAKKLGKGAVSGEIIAGVEPIEDTLRAIDYITGVGAFPTVCVFRPTVGSDMEQVPSPSFEDMKRVFQHLYEACMRNGIPIGIAPGIDVSLIVQPDDCEYLVKPSLRYWMYKAKLNLFKIAAAPMFRRRQRPRKRGNVVWQAPRAGAKTR